MCYDETLKPFGGTNVHGGKQKVSRPRGNHIDRNLYAAPVSAPNFSLMICAAASTDVNCSYPRPCITWVKSDKEEIKALQERVVEANEKDLLYCLKQQEQALIPDTEEYKHMEKVNKAIQAHNNELKKIKQRKGRKHKRTPQQEFKHEIFTYNVDQKGMNTIWYAEHIFKKHVIPY